MLEEKRENSLDCKMVTSTLHINTQGIVASRSRSHDRHSCPYKGCTRIHPGDVLQRLETELMILKKTCLPY